MRATLLEELELICPCCRYATEEGLVLFSLEWREIYEQQDDYVIEGLLACTNKNCNATFPIVAGVPIILKDIAGWWQQESPGPATPEHCSPAMEEYFHSLDPVGLSTQEEESLVGAYMGLHYAGLGDEADPYKAREINHSYWQQLMQWGEPKEKDAFGIVLDVGCSTGRFTFELARKSKLAVGMDLKFSLVAAAARIQREEKVVYRRKRYGGQFDTVHSNYDPTDNVFFLVGDALNPPFRASTFDFVAALNVLDNVSIPLVLIGQMNGLLDTGGRMLIGCPYEWLSTITEPMEWLGNESMEPAIMLKKIVAGEAFPQMGLYYEVVQEILEIPWAIRHHDRHWGFYISHLLLAEKYDPSNRD